jgi:hypothetical protein
MASGLRPFHPRSAQDARRDMDREFTELTGLMRRVTSALAVASDPLDRARLASELRHVQLEIDAFLKRHEAHISPPTRKYLDNASLQIEIKLTAMAARAARHARHARMRPRRA